MDADRFDALTRALTTGWRRRALVAALGAGLAPLLGGSDAAAHDPSKTCKKKSGKQKKTCLKKAKAHNARHAGEAPTAPAPPAGCPAGTSACRGGCIPSNQCCADADCPMGAGFRCCSGICTNTKLPAGSVCEVSTDCCSEHCRFAFPHSRRCASTRLGRFCETSADCDGLQCAVSFRTHLSCGGCELELEACGSNDDCCYSDCVLDPGGERVCASHPGGPCSFPVDCYTCAFDEGTCEESCVNGICQCPYQCCSFADCPPQHNCIKDANGLNGECKPQVIGT